jgi:hypothetical protein
MLLLTKTFGCAMLIAVNFYGAALLFQQPHLLKKVGQLLLLLMLVTLLHLALKRQLVAATYAAVPLLSSILFLLLMLAGLPSKAGPKSLPAPPLALRLLPGKLSSAAVFFTLLCPAFVSLIQALTLLK